jgi:hypothetical protein
MNEASIDRTPIHEKGGTRVTNIAKAETAFMAGKPYEGSHEGHNKQYDTFQDYLNNENHMKHEGQGSRGSRIDHELEQEDEEQIAQKNAARAQKEMDKEQRGHGHHAIGSK